jgi:hypothetical protein
MAGTNAIHVVATVNMTKGFGTLRHVNPLPAVAAGRELARGRKTQEKRSSRGPSLALRVYSRGGRSPVEYPATFIPDACRDAGADETGAIDVLLPPSKNPVRLELVFNGSVVDTFVPGASGAVRDIRQASRAARARAGSEDDDNPVLTWSSGGGSARKRSAAGASAPTYTVQVSTDEGRTWQTAGFALKEPQVTIDRQMLGDASAVRVRVTATNGFESKSTETTIRM